MNFERAEYVEPQVIEGQVVGRTQPTVAGAASFPLALLYGAIAAAIGCVGYTLIGFSGIMVSIVAIGVGWLVARAMMTASGGIGGRQYQVAAVVLTYFAVTAGELFDSLHYNQLPLSVVFRLRLSVLAEHLIAGPFLALQNPINGVIGLVIIGVGLRAAWRLAAGSPGFGNTGAAGPRMTPFG